MMRYLLLLLTCLFCGGVLLDSRSAWTQNTSAKKIELPDLRPYRRQTDIEVQSAPRFWQALFGELGIPEAQSVEKAPQFAASAQAFHESWRASIDRYQARWTGGMDIIEATRRKYAEEHENYRNTLVLWRNFLDDNRHHRAVYRVLVRQIRERHRRHLARDPEFLGDSLEALLVERYTNLIKLCDEMIARSHAEDRPDDQQVPKDTPSSPFQMAPPPPKTPEFAPPAAPEPSEPMPPTDSELLTPGKKTVGDALLEYAQLAQKGQQPSQSLEEFIESFTGAPHSAPGAQTQLSHQELLETYLAHQSESPGGWKEAAFEKATQPLVDMSEVLAEQVLAAVPEQQAVVPSVEEVDAQVADWFGFDVADSDAPETKATLDVQRELMDALLQKDVSPDDIREALPADLREKIADDPEGFFGAHWHLVREMLPEDVREIGDEWQDISETLQTASELPPDAGLLYLFCKAAARVARWLGHLLPPGVADTLVVGAELVPHAVQAGQTIQTFGLDEGRVSARDTEHPINQVLQNHTGTEADELRLDTADGPRIIRVNQWDTVEIDGETFYLALDDKDSPTGILVKHQPGNRRFLFFGERDKVTVYQADTSGSPLRGYTIGSVREANVLEPQR